jgi:hypothetical protein
VLTAAWSASAWRPWGTFPLGSPRFFAHSGLVLGAWLVVAVASWAVVRGRHWLLTACFTAPAGALLAAAVTGLQTFPDALPVLWGALLAAGALWLLVGRRLVLTAAFSSAVALGLFLGGAAGVLLILAERPPPPGTRPRGGGLPAPDELEGELTLSCGAARLRIHPLLLLDATSRDGFWPGFSLADPLEGAPQLAGPGRRAALSHGPDSVDATTVLPHPVASHLSRFTDVFLEGTTRPGVHFAGTAEGVVFPFEPFDYPKGRPAHFAFVRGADLVVARGTDAEKGPFVPLAGGPLPDGVLRFTLFDGAAPLCTVAFLDFAAQADVDSESPTAGEGVAPNVIQFGLPGQGPARPMLHLSLAETSIGGGLETVRHASGTYRNRIRVTSPSAP